MLGAADLKSGPTGIEDGRPEVRPYEYHEAVMAKLTSELEIECPCCGSTLTVDLNLRRVIGHREPEKGFRPELTDAQRILAEEAARREAAFEQSVNAERTRGDALSRRFEEALKQARTEPVTKPTRDFDLD